MPSRAAMLLLATAWILLAGIFSATSGLAAAEPRFIALCYHNVEDSDPDQTYVGVTTGKLIEQLSWLDRNGYRFISVDDLIAARDGRHELPSKSVLLTFDDGFESFYTRVYPVLKALRAPAIFAVTGAWVTGRPGDFVTYGDRRLPRDFFVSWDQVREMMASGLVEIASHTDALHQGILANPQGNAEPAVVTHRFDTHSGYETEEAYRRRLDGDTEAMARLIQKETGRRPRVLVWPYGEYNRLAVTIGAAHGMPITLSLAEGSATLSALGAVPRELINQDPSLASFVTDLRQIDRRGPVRAVQLDLDYVYDPDPAQMDRNVGVLVQRIHDLSISTVYLQAFADPNGSGLVRQVYFPNRQLPMRADLFNRVAWQLRTRARVQVYAWMPVLAFDFGDAGPMQHVAPWNPAADPAISAAAKENYQRLSPFDPTVRRRIRELYEDLARSAPVAGLLFHDDALLSDHEDASSAALDAYAKAGLPRSIDAIRGDPQLFARWTRLKTDALIDFTQELAAAVRQYRAPLRTARNIYARPLLEPQSEAWFAQQYDRFLAAYDEVVVMAMPRMEGVPDAEADAWLRRLVVVASSRPGGLAKTVFELQAVDWRKGAKDPGRHISSEVLAGEMRLLSRLGALSFGYYPDDFVSDLPKLQAIRPAFSLQSHPYREP